jgi:hypothetical protein
MGTDLHQQQSTNLSQSKDHNIREQLRIEGRRRRPVTLALGLIYGIASIFTDFHLAAGKRALAQEIIWSICTTGILFSAYQKFLTRWRLIVTFFIVVAIHGGISILAYPLFPLSNSLLTILFWAPEAVFLLIMFVVVARVADPSGGIR